ncbi:hypothetical protein DFH08DRAFT_906712 [Mycena albidolilacea]|uniref:Uncharacterized protein n=1 Tax=Mycena albidolilacea TaxID=1033008 RepID=A0AAD6YY95_9AGAR|nr:hypothetical protein DFH08DRAFT_906712 [Mycena albidolilacea]
MRVISLISVASALFWATSAAPVEESSSSSHELRLRQNPLADRREAEISDLDARILWRCPGPRDRWWMSYHVRPACNRRPWNWQRYQYGNLR